MAEEEKKSKIKPPKSPLIGAQAQPTVLSDTTKLDIDTDKKFVDNIIDATLSNSLDTGEINKFTTIANNRDQIYQLIDTMMNDSSVASIVRTYAEDVCESSDSGHIVWAEANDPKISKFINYLLNVMNVDKNIYGWVYSLIKYGDVYLKLYRESDYKDPLFKKDNVDKAFNAKTTLNESTQTNEAIYLSMHSVGDPYSYYIEMIPDPGTMFELTKYGKTFGFIETPNVENEVDYMTNYASNTNNTGVYNYRMKSNDINVYQADDFVHACLDDNQSRFPEKVDIFLTDEDYNSNLNSQSYSVRRGKSLLYDSYKIWREKALLENAALLNRITKSSLARLIQIEVGDMPKSQVQNTVQRVKQMFEQKTALNVGSSMSEYNNPGPIENNIYLATHQGMGAITVNQVGGDVDVKNLADLDYWNNKFYSSYGIPKQYFGWTDDGAGFNGGSSLTILSSVYAKGVKRVQNAIIQAITDAINLILVNKGCKSYLNNFVLKMKEPSTQEEKDYREELGNRITAISNMQSLFADVEDKPRRLEILKNLFATLNYGDQISDIIDDEIKAAEQKAKEDAEKAAEEEAAGAESGEMGSLGSEEPAEEEKPEENNDLDLGLSSEAPMESFTNNGGGQALVEGPDFLTEDDDDLPTPEEINSHKDFSRNE